MIDFNTLKRRKETFARVTGVKLEYFWLIVEKVKPFWEKWLVLKQCHGRDSHVKTLENEILMVLIYYRCYVSHFMLGMYFGLDVSNVCRHLQRMEPMIAKAIHIKKDCTLTADNLHKILIDATQVQTQRIVVGHVFAHLEIFKILSSVYRNFRRKLHMGVNIIAGIYNLKFL